MKEGVEKISNSVDSKGVIKTCKLVADKLCQNIAHKTNNLVRRFIQETIFKYKYGTGIKVVNEDWDNLIILDACRYDDFKRICELKGDLKSQISLGTDSPQFLLRNFSGEQLHDTVYITANPHYVKIKPNTFHAVVDEPISNWDSESQCIKPSEVTKAALRAHSKYPNKRLIIHYMQPHDPPLGKTGERLRERINIKGPSPIGKENNDSGMRIMEAVEQGLIPTEDARNAYRETLSIVLDEVKVLLDNMGGKSIITSDHGEMFGEKPYPFIGRMYEHGGLPTEELNKVPWFTVSQQSGRRTIVPEPPEETESAEEIKNDINDQLEALGYK